MLTSATIAFTYLGVQLLRERMRSFDSGITSFDLHKEYVGSSSGFVLFAAGVCSVGARDASP